MKTSKSQNFNSPIMASAGGGICSVNVGGNWQVHSSKQYKHEQDISETTRKE